MEGICAILSVRLLVSPAVHWSADGEASPDHNKGGLRMSCEKECCFWGPICIQSLIWDDEMRRANTSLVGK
jgi:hypothetical protein